MRRRKFNCNHCFWLRKFPISKYRWIEMSCSLFANYLKFRWNLFAKNWKKGQNGRKCCFTVSWIQSNRIFVLYQKICHERGKTQHTHKTSFLWLWLLFVCGFSSSFHHIKASNNKIGYRLQPNHDNMGWCNQHESHSVIYIPFGIQTFAAAAASVLNKPFHSYSLKHKNLKFALLF